MNIIQILVLVFYLYLFLGGVFAIWFVLHGVNRLDEGMHGVSWKLRVLIFPGSVLLWPVLLLKILKHE